MSACCKTSVKLVLKRLSTSMRRQPNRRLSQNTRSLHQRASPRRARARTSMLDPALWLWLVPGLPLVAAISTALLGPTLLKQRSHVPTIICSAGASICAALILSSHIGAPEDNAIGSTTYTWFAAGSFTATFSVQADTLTAVML